MQLQGKVIAMSIGNISSDLIRGHIDTIILKVLLDSDNYGYEIIKSIFKKSDNEYELKEPSLYTSLKRLEKDELIRSYWGEESQGGRRKYYHITNAGEEELSKSINQWLTAQRIINTILLQGGKTNG